MPFICNIILTKYSIMKNLYFLLLIFIFAACSDTKKENQSSNLKSEYLGQPLPGDSAELFAPGIISTGAYERDLAVTPDCKEIFFRRMIDKYYTIYYTKEVNGEWTKPEVFKYCRDTAFRYLEPFVSHDGSKLLFVSDKSLIKGEKSSCDIWVSEKDENNNWQEPYNIGAPVNTDQNEYYPSLTKDGTMYYTSFDTELKEEFIYRSKLVDGKYTDTERLNDNVNCGKERFNSFISPDESFIIIPTVGMPDSFGGVDYYIVFRDKDDNWSSPITMGPKINTAKGGGWAASLSPNGNYLFFMSSKTSENNSTQKGNSQDELKDLPQNGLADIYWIKSDFINKLKEKAVFNK